MLEKILKKDKNKELEKILEKRNIDEQAKNLLQSILYKIEVSYNDYKIVKSKKETVDKYIEKILNNIDKKCDTIKIVKLKQKLADEEIQTELQRKKYYVGKEIVAYPIEEKLLYAIEVKSDNKKILNGRYGEKAIAISEFINTGKNLDRVEVLRDFSGWSWNTTKSEIENIEANLVYQTLQILLGEEFLENWCEDRDGIIDYLEMFSDEMSQKFGTEIEENLKDLIIKIAMVSTIKQNAKFRQNVEQKIEKLRNEVEDYNNTQKKIGEITEYKKELLKEKKEIEKILKEIEDANNLLNPTNYLKEKNRLIKEKEELESFYLETNQLENLLIEYLKYFLKAFTILIRKAKESEEIVQLIYKIRYFMFLTFNIEKSIKDVEEIEKEIIKVEKQLIKKAIDKKVIANIPFEIMEHVFKTRIIILEELYYKITNKNEKQYVQIFDENISQEKFEITLEEKTKINKKIRIFI